MCEGQDLSSLAFPASLWLNFVPPSVGEAQYLFSFFSALGGTKNDSDELKDDRSARLPLGKHGSHRRFSFTYIFCLATLPSAPLRIGKFENPTEDNSHVSRSCC